MRIWPRLTTLVPLLLTMAVSPESSAQMMMGHPSYGAPTFMGGQPANSAVDPRGMPQSFQSHPMISPFDHAMEQHFSSDGLWFKRILSGNGRGSSNDYFFNVSYLRTNTRGLTHRIGDQSAPTFTQEELIDGTGGNLPDALTLNNFNPAGGNMIPDIVSSGMLLSGGLRNRLGWGMNWDINWNSKATQTYDAREYYESQRLGLSSVDALQLEASAGEGLFRNGFSRFRERELVENEILTGQPIATALTADFGFFGDATDILDRQLFNLNAIPLQNGVDFDGFNERFDLDFIMQHSVETYGAGIDFSSAPVYESDGVKLSPVVGGRFMQINEGFNFRGVDSGLLYTQNIPDGVDDDDDFVVDNVAETGTATFTAGNPSTDSLIRAFVDSSVQSTMGGPEIGLQYSLGEGQGFTLVGSTKVGALFNTEKLRLAGDNIGDTVTTDIDLATGDTILQDMFDTSTSTTPLTQNAFSDGKTSTHVSPMFQQSFRAEMPIFARIPVLRDIWQLENAKLTAGWTGLWIGEVASPNRSIVWVSNPRANVFPHLNVKRTGFFQSSLNCGINWEY